MIRIKHVIARLEKQQRELASIVVALREVEASPAKELRGVTSLNAYLDSCERQIIANALIRANGNQMEAARMLSVGRDQLRYRMAKHGIRGCQTRRIKGKRR